MRLEGKTIIVTGASRGIGEGIARAAAAEGARVAVASTTIESCGPVAEAIRAAGGEAIAVSVDVASEDSCRRMAAEVCAGFGGIDGLVNNAAIFGKLASAPLLTCDLDYYFKVMRVNMNGALIATRACYQAMAERGGGSIVNISSTAAYMNVPSFYGVTKTGLNGLTRALAKELGPHRIRINAVAPGPISTEATLSRAAPEVRDQWVEQMAIKRMGQVDDVTGACTFLLSDEARWITSQTIIVDGGMISRF